MKRRARILAALVVLVIVAAFLVSCNLSKRGEQAKSLCRQMTDAILADDFDTAYGLISNTCSSEEFREEYDGFCSLLDGIESYELKQMSFHSEIKSGVSCYSATYSIVTENKVDLEIEVAITEGHDGLTRYHVSQVTAVNCTGTLATLGQFNLPQWGLLLLSILGMALVIWMVIDCARRKLNAKALWIILILIGHLRFSVTGLVTELSTDFRIGAFLPYSRLLLYEDGTFALSLVLPVGAAVYFFMRKWLTEKYEEPMKISEKKDQDGPDLEP